MTNIFNRIPVRIRISFGLVGLMTGTILLASAGGFFPNAQREVLRGSRQALRDAGDQRNRDGLVWKS